MTPLLLLFLAQITGGTTPPSLAPAPVPGVTVHRPRPAGPMLRSWGWPWSAGFGASEVTILQPAPPPQTDKQRIEGLIVASPLYQPEKAKPRMREYPNLPEPVRAASQTPPAGSR